MSDSNTLEVGVSRQSVMAVTEELCTSHLGPQIGSILATPKLCGVFEDECIAASLPHLSDGLGTVGVEMHLKHMAPTPKGFDIRTTVELVQMDYPKLLWKIEAFDSAGKIAEGEHLRAVVQLERMGERVERKRREGSAKLP